MINCPIMENSGNKSDKLSFSFIRGSADPRLATCRGKLQNRRCKLNQEINKELRLRAGAENLYKATTNKKLKDTVALELSFVNSNLQLLKEQLAELNSSVDIYQNDEDPSVPMIPLGLKETKEITFQEIFSDFILEHYSEDPAIYEEAIADFSDTRQASRTPARDSTGVALLFRYYNLLYFVERRFFPVDRNIGIYFEWYDSLTGVPSCQKTVAFEKACTLFNLGAIYTQIGSKQNRTSEKELDYAVDNFLRAAGVFKHIYDTFTNAPSMDLKPPVLEVFVLLMLAQARECLFEKLQLQMEAMSLNGTTHVYTDLAGEASQLMTEYSRIHQNIQNNYTHTYLPDCWIGLVPLKAELYKVLAHYYSAKSINLSDKKEDNEGDKHETFIFNNNSQFNESDEEIKPIYLKKVHLREAQSSHEETQRLQRMCRDLKNKLKITEVLRQLDEKILDELNKIDEIEMIDSEDLELIEVSLNISTKFTLTLTGPDFTNHKIEDPFRKLGPIAIFSARRNWTAPRCIRLHKTNTYYNNYSNRSRFNDDDESGDDDNDKEDSGHQSLVDFGFRLKGDAPVMISRVEINSLADLGGIKEGDFIVEISGIDAKWFNQKQALDLIKIAGNNLDLRVITPMNKNYSNSKMQSAHAGSYATLSDTSSSGISSGASSPMSTTTKPIGAGKSRKLNKSKFSSISSSTWNPFKRTNSIGKIF